MSYAGEEQGGKVMREQAGMLRRLKLAAVAMGVAALVSGCGIFGCGGSATNGGAFGGCGAGMRF
jgi:hypothetical protein